VVVVAEGAKPKDGKVIVYSSGVDEFGNVRLGEWVTFWVRSLRRVWTLKLALWFWDIFSGVGPQRLSIEFWALGLVWQLSILFMRANLAVWWGFREAVLFLLRWKMLSEKEKRESRALRGSECFLRIEVQYGFSETVFRS